MALYSQSVAYFKFTDPDLYRAGSSGDISIAAFKPSLGGAAED